MVSTGANASGSTSRSLELKASAVKNKITFNISGGVGFDFVEGGRGATKKGNKGMLRKIIRQWIDDKGITPDGKMTKDDLAFVITRAIHQRGTLLHLLGETRAIQSAVITDKRINSITDKIKYEVQNEVSKQIISEFQV
jgi:hypothetical protein